MFARNLSGLAALAVAMLASTAALAQVSDDVIKIGVLTDMNGPASTPTGQGSVTAAQMAIDDFGGKVLGKPISLIIGDHQLKPDIGGGIARRWYDVEQVDLILDVPVSAVGLAVQGIANEKKWGYNLAVAAAILNVLLLFMVFGISTLTNLSPLISFGFDAALVALLLHPMSRDYQRIWFR